MMSALNCTLGQISEIFADGSIIVGEKEGHGKVVACEKKIRFPFHIQKGRIIYFILTQLR